MHTHVGLPPFLWFSARVNMTAYPGLVDVPWYLATVNAGDCLFLPYGWIHHVHQYLCNAGCCMAIVSIAIHSPVDMTHFCLDCSH